MLKNYFPAEGKVDFFLHFFGDFFASYFSVKIFNPYKKCDLYLDIAKKCDLASLPISEKNVLINAKNLLDKLGEKNLEKDLSQTKNLIELYFTARIIGYFFAEIFHQKIDSIDEKNKSYVKKVTFLKPLAEKEFYQLSDILFMGQDLKKLKKRYF